MFVMLKKLDDIVISWVRRVKKNYPIRNIIVISTIRKSLEIPTRNAARVNMLFLRHRQALFDSTALQGQSELSTYFEYARRKLKNIWKSAMKCYN
jgi:hypothetical protein